MDDPAAIDPRRLRALAARSFLAEDAWWAADTLKGLAKHPSGDLLSFALLPIAARIAYEGSVLLRSKAQGVGEPVLAALLNEEHTAAIAASRHLAKYLDHTGTTLEEYEATFERLIDEHREDFRRSVRFNWMRRLQKDLGMYCIDGHVFSTTLTTHVRLGLAEIAPGSALSQPAFDLARTIGSLLMVHSAALGQPFAGEGAAMAEAPSRFSLHDYHSHEFFTHWPVKSNLSNGSRALLLMVAADVNTALRILPLTARRRYEESVVRSQVITATHALRALRELLPDESESLLATASARALESPQGRAGRNRCMHYEIRSRSLEIDPNLPMCGVIEGVAPDLGWAGLERAARTVLGEVSESLAVATPTRW